MISIDVKGFSDQYTQRWFEFSCEDRKVVIPARCFRVGETEGYRLLAEQGIVVFTANDKKGIESQLRSINDWPNKKVAETSGWTGLTFILPSGRQFVPKDGDTAFCAFNTMQSRCEKKGSGPDWKREVASQLIGQQIPTFMMCFMFMPPLLSMVDRNINIGFELVGGPGVGKSTVQQIVSSVIGRPTRNSGSPYWVTMDTTVNALEQTMRIHQDLPLVMDEANLFGAEGSKSKKAKAFQDIAFKLGGGSQKKRFGEQWHVNDCRLGFLISSNEPLSDLLGQSGNSAKAALDRIITVPVPETNPYRVFDSLPEGYPTGSDFAASLVASCEKNYGFAIRRYLKNLVKDQGTDDNKLKRKIAKWMEAFRNAVDVDGNDGSQVRVADSFGLVFAAGELAKRYGVLPDEMDCMQAALTCYYLNRNHYKPMPPFKDRLSAVADDPLTVRWTREGKSKKISQASAILRKDKGELWVRASSMSRVFPDWEIIKTSTEVRNFIVATEKDRLTDKRNVGPKRKPVRVYRFLLPSRDNAEKLF